MQDELTIGLVLPVSSVLPIAKDFEKGLKSGLGDYFNRVEIVREYIGNGDLKLTTEAVQKLITYDDADLIVGVLNNKVVNGLASKFVNKKTVLFVNNLGAIWPNSDDLNANILTNTMQAWEQVWALSHWATKKFGPRGMMVTGTFDAGFSFASAFDQGMLEAREDTSWSFAVAPAPMAQQGELAEVQKVIPKIKENAPDFLFAAFCGEEARQFLELYTKEGLSESTPLIALPYLLETTHQNFENPIKIYSVKSASKEAHQDYKNPVLWKSSFYQLGNEAGQIIARALSENIDFKELRNMEHQVERGLLTLDPLKVNNLNMFLSEVSHHGDSIHLSATYEEELSSISLNHPNISRLSKEASSNWFNPYLAL